MGRPSNRDLRRAEIVAAFARVLATHGYAGATIAAVAEEAGVAPGLLHHHFANKEEILEALMNELVRGFRERIRHYEIDGDPLVAYADAALRLDDRADVVAARCWAGLFAEAIRNPRLFRSVRRLLDTEIASIEERSGHRLTSQEAGAILAYVVGAIVLGAFAPQKTAGFAAPGLRRLIAAMRAG